MSGQRNAAAPAEGATSPQAQRITRQQVQERFDRLTEILAGIATHAGAQAAWRCPYRDRHDRCTAPFRCRNQRPPAGAQTHRGSRSEPPSAARDSASTPGSPVSAGGADPGAEPDVAVGGILVCGHDGTFDYRDAWETDPGAVEHARRKVARIRQKARARTREP